MDKEKAIKATKNGAVAAFISAGITLAVVLFAVFSNAEGYFGRWNDPSIFLDVIIIVICGFGMLRHSRAAAIVIFIYFVFAKIYIGLESGKMSGSGMALVFLYFYGKAIQGAFAYHKIQKEEKSNYKATPKWMYYVGIPTGVLALALMGSGLLTMTGVLPSTKVVTGSEMPSKDISLLTEKGVIHPNEKIEYFYSEGFSSILEGGSILTDNRVVVYVQEEGDLQIYELPFQDIVSIELIKQGNFLNPSVYKVRSFHEDVWIPLFLSTEDRGDVIFVEELRKRVKETNNINKDPQKEEVASYKPSEIFSQNNEAVVLVRSYDGSGNLIGFGSGFNVHENGVIVTNLHVVLSGGSYLDIKFPKHGTYEDVYIAGFSDFSTDLAVLRIDGKELPKVNISPSVPVNVGDRIYTISNPEGLLNTLSEGLVSAERVVDNTTFYQITAPISEGSSGGAVFNEFGEVIGVASMIMKKGQNLNFAISIDEFSRIEKFEEYFTLKDLMDYFEKQKEENP